VISGFEPPPPRPIWDGFWERRRPQRREPRAVPRVADRATSHHIPGAVTRGKSGVVDISGRDLARGRAFDLRATDITPAVRRKMAGWRPYGPLVARQLRLTCHRPDDSGLQRPPRCPSAVDALSVRPPLQSRSEPRKPR